MNSVIKLSAPSEQIRRARPDTIVGIGQLTAGQVVIGFNTYHDPDGVINSHLARLAIVRGAAYRIVDGTIIDGGIQNGTHIIAEPLDSFTLPRQIYGDPRILRLGGRAIGGIEEPEFPGGIASGFLAVREEPYQIGQSLEVGPGLYINGANDYHTLFEGRFMAVALDSDPRLAGQLG